MTCHRHASEYQLGKSGSREQCYHGLDLGSPLSLDIDGITGASADGYEHTNAEINRDGPRRKPLRLHSSGGFDNAWIRLALAALYRPVVTEARDCRFQDERDGRRQQVRGCFARYDLSGSTAGVRWESCA
ncbi:hypothetical protein Tco_0821501 [Tanacetum coccineum]|uniref:Uncharacterized protein n=1 Tax=Tanacetum coccineum TaxID=301880 RepID=A0ABQ5AF18_9ASTR